MIAQLTVGKLKKLLHTIDDDTRVILDGNDHINDVVGINVEGDELILVGANTPMAEVLGL